MFKSHLGAAAKAKVDSLSLETAEEFQARGGNIQKVSKKVFGTRTKAIDAQKLFDSVVGTQYEGEVVKLLRSKGIQVEGL